MGVLPDHLIDMHIEPRLWLDLPRYGLVFVQMCDGPYMMVSLGPNTLSRIDETINVLWYFKIRRERDRVIIVVEDSDADGTAIESAIDRISSLFAPSKICLTVGQHIPCFGRVYKSNNRLNRAYFSDPWNVKLPSAPLDRYIRYRRRLRPYDWDEEAEDYSRRSNFIDSLKTDPICPGFPMAVDLIES